MAPPQSGTVAITALDAMPMPFISHTTPMPSIVLRHTTSVFPSLLKSPLPLGSQDVDTTLSTEELAIVVPFISQIAFVPSLSRHRMSDLPLPSKSPTSEAPQLSGTLVTSAEAAIVAPFISQIATELSLARHRMSDLPWPSKSPTPAMNQF